MDGVPLSPIRVSADRGVTHQFLLLRHGVVCGYYLIALYNGDIGDLKMLTLKLTKSG